MSPGGPLASRRLEFRPFPTSSTSSTSHHCIPAEHDDDPTATHCNVGTKPCTAVISGTPTTAPAPALLPLGASSFVLLGPAVGIDKPDMLRWWSGGAGGDNGLRGWCAGGGGDSSGVIRR